VYSPIYDQFPLVVCWKDDGGTIKKFVEQKVGSASRKVQGEDKYFQPGFVFARRTKGFSPKIMPRGGIYSTGGQAGFLPFHDLKWGIALLSSRICTYLISISQGRTGSAAQFEVGLVKRIPWPEQIDDRTKQILSEITQKVFDLKGDLDSVDEASNLFVVPALVRVFHESLAKSAEKWNNYAHSMVENLEGIQRSIDDIGFQVYQISNVDRLSIQSNVNSVAGSCDEEFEAENQEGEIDHIRNSRNTSSLVADVISYCVGVTFGRLDVRCAIVRYQQRNLPNLFAPYPVCSPGVLQGSDGLPLTNTPEGYPLEINWDGILVDDPDHRDDTIRRIRDVIEMIWKDRAEAIEKEACEILGVRELRDYFRKPGKGGFWDDHVSRYSKSRRKAPVYWLLQSSKKNYALWIYNHRFDKDMLFKALLNYVEPKIRLEESRLESLRAQRTAAGTSGKGVKKLEKEIDRQEEFISELRDFEDKLRRVANLHLAPDLNDGVVLNIAPLCELVPWKEAKKYWDELRDGEYEWSSIGKQLRQKGIAHGP